MSFWIVEHVCRFSNEFTALELSDGCRLPDKDTGILFRIQRVGLGADAGLGGAVVGGERWAAWWRNGLRDRFTGGFARVPAVACFAITAFLTGVPGGVGFSGAELSWCWGRSGLRSSRCRKGANTRSAFGIWTKALFQKPVIRAFPGEAERAVRLSKQAGTPDGVEAGSASTALGAGFIGGEFRADRGTEDTVLYAYQRFRSNEGSGTQERVSAESVFHKRKNDRQRNHMTERLFSARGVGGHPHKNALIGECGSSNRGTCELALCFEEPRDRGGLARFPNEARDRALGVGERGSAGTWVAHNRKIFAEFHEFSGGCGMNSHE